jgi:hypothetical protein
MGRTRNVALSPNIRGDEYVGELNMVEYFEQVKEEIVNLK